MNSGDFPVPFLRRVDGLRFSGFIKEGDRVRFFFFFLVCFFPKLLYDTSGTEEALSSAFHLHIDPLS